MLWRPRSAVHCAQSVGNKIGRHVYVYRRGLAYLLACLCDANTITNDSSLRRECFSAWAGRRMLCDHHKTASQGIAHVLSVHRGAAPLIRYASSFRTKHLLCILATDFDWEYASASSMNYFLQLHDPILAPFDPLDHSVQSHSMTVRFLLVDCRGRL